MTTKEFLNEMHKMGIPCDIHQAMSGSQYIRINGNCYRLSDHNQPSYYQVRNYINVESYAEILENVKHLARPINRESFVNIYLNGSTYYGNQILKQGDYYSNGKGLFVDLKSAANNLYYHLIEKKS